MTYYSRPVVTLDVTVCCWNFNAFQIQGAWKRWFFVPKSDMSCHFFQKKYFDLRNQHCFSYIMTAREEDYVACDATLFSWNFNVPGHCDSGSIDFTFKKVACHVIFLKKKIWSCCFTFWYFDNKSRKSRIRPWHIFERVFNGFRTFIIRNYWKISISPVSDSDTLWNRYFLTSIIAIRTGNVVSIIDKFICWNFNIF